MPLGQLCQDAVRERQASNGVRGWVSGLTSKVFFRKARGLGFRVS